MNKLKLKSGLTSLDQSVLLQTITFLDIKLIEQDEKWQLNSSKFCVGVTTFLPNLTLLKMDHLHFVSLFSLVHKQDNLN